MEPGTPAAPTRPADQAAPVPRQRRVRLRATLAEPVPDEPIAVLFAGGGEHHAVLGALLGGAGAVVPVPDDSYLVVAHGDRCGPFAHVPGSRHARSHPSADADADEPARPPRRVELRRPDPLLRHFTLLAAPDTRGGGVAGARVLTELARRGGAVVYTLPADRAVTPDELALLRQLASAEVGLFFVLTPDRNGGWGAAAADPDPASTSLAGRRAALTEQVAELADAPWFAVDPTCGDTAYLRRALIEWAGVEGLRRASGNPPMLPGAGRSVPVAAGAQESGWSARLDRLLYTAARAVRQQVAIELANIHLRCVHEVMFGAGCAGLAPALDRELHALSVQTVNECEAVAATVVDEILPLVLDGPIEAGVRQRVAAAVRQGLAEEPGDGPARVLLVTGTGGVASVAGDAAVAALWAYHPVAAPALLPPVGVALSAGCYQRWQRAGAGDASAARTWVFRAVREVELDLLREVTGRFEALGRVLGAVLSEAVDHGVLLR